MSQRRIGRACDLCNSSRTRCNGDLPCDRCKTLGRSCQYKRKFKKRGRKAAVTHKSPLPTEAHCDLDVPSTPSSAGIHPTSFGPARDESSIDGVPAVSGFLSMGRHEHPESHEPVTMNNLEATFATYQDNISRAFDFSQPESGATALSPIPRFPTLALTPPDASATSASSRLLPVGCRFPCLEPLLPHLKSVLSPEEACSLLEIFFTEPGESAGSSHSPYVLSPVLRRSVVLDPIKPRPISPALLATMLWCAAHTANGRLYYIPGSRARIIDHLYCLVMSLLQRGDPDNWRRVNGGWQLESDCVSDLGAGDLDRPRRTFGTGPTPAVDDVLTFVILTIVISGGEYKSDCLKWWNKALRLIKHLGFHQDPLRTGQPERGSLQVIEEQEEQRRAFWLVYALDRHLAVSHNRAVYLLDAECKVLTPLPESCWQRLDAFTADTLPSRTYGPPTVISGTGLFEYFLPLMSILGDIIELRLWRHHPRLKFDEHAVVSAIDTALTNCHESVSEWLREVGRTANGSRPSSMTPRAEVTMAYASYIIKVLFVMLYGEWDATSMLENHGDWITSAQFSECASHSIAAAQQISYVLSIDPELSFMPYLVGIYLFHGSLVLLLFAERMPLVGPNPSVEEACEVIIRAHEASIVTLSTDFQKAFRKAFRSVLLHPRAQGEVNTELRALRQDILSMYRWTLGDPGLCL